MYRHGIYVSEQETSMIAPLNGTAAVSYTHLTLQTILRV